MTLGTEWCTVDEVKALLAQPFPTDTKITESITTATSALLADFCVTPLDTTPEDTYPDDWKVRRATAVLAAQGLLASPMSGNADEEVESESIGGYSYKVRQARSQATAYRIDGHVQELIAGYLCPKASGVYDLSVGPPELVTSELDDESSVVGFIP